VSEKPEMPKVDHAAVREFYDSEYYGQEGGGGIVPWHPRLMAARLGDLHGKSVLDVACGTGQWLAEMARRGATVAGVDISTRAVELCKAHLPQAEVYQSVAEALPFDSGRFDIVTCLGSLEHFLDQPRALREMVRVARPGARFVILVPNGGFLTRRLGLYKGTAQVAVRETVYPLAEWELLLRDAGLVVTRRWRDLHTLSKSWICRGNKWQWPMRAAQAMALALWPVAWQYQVYFDCVSRESHQ
jgi:2-polyprenyl-3-methyl-5-hydroxy-6-metoxy-1,4-benzoquinol methylase